MAIIGIWFGLIFFSYFSYFSVGGSLEYAVFEDRYSGNQTVSGSLEYADMADLDFCFQPFSTGGNLEKGPWLPFSDFHDGSYDKFMETYRNLTKNVTGKALEEAAENILKILVIAAEHRTKAKIEPSGIWEADIGKAAGITWRPFYGMLLDDLFTAIARPQPSTIWYIRILAARDSLFQAWIANPRQHTRATTLMTLALSNILAVLDIRFLALQGGRKTKWSRNLSKGLAVEWGELLTRPNFALHDRRYPEAINFIRTQASAITGNLPLDSHLTYLMLTGGKPYVGRTAGHRTPSTTTVPGIAARWSEHIRELYRHGEGTVPQDKQRRRYNELTNRHCVNCFNCLVLEITDTSNIKAAEAKAITLINPGANGSELKHFSETFRNRTSGPRKAGRKPRQRKSQSIRKRTRPTSE